VALRVGHDRKTRAVVRVVLHGGCHHVQAEFAARPRAGNGGQAVVQRCQTCAFGIAGNRATFGVRQVGRQPCIALRQRLRVGDDGRHIGQRIDLAQQVVAHEAGLADDEQRRVTIQRT
jgi:hypothetical protein